MSKSRRIGYDLIYPQQERIGQRVLEWLWANERRPPQTKNKRTPVVVGQQQVGKTGIMISIISGFIDDCVRRRRTFQIVVPCGLSQLDLKGQTLDRLTQGVRHGNSDIGAMLHAKVLTSGLHRYPLVEQQRVGILITNNSQTLRRLNLNMKVDVRLWIGDEVHLGNVRDGNLDTMYRNHGVFIEKQIHEWAKTGTVNHVVGISATPAAHMIKSEICRLRGDALFETFYETPPSSYNSMAKMLDKGRLKERYPLFRDDGSASDFLLQVRRDFEASCEADGPGYLVIRATGGKQEQLVEYVSHKGRHIEYEAYDAKEKNLDGLTDRLSQEPDEPTWIVIRGSMRAGITLGAKHFIRGWVETDSATSDAQAQAGVGRACGYGRTRDTYPIYCDIGHIKAWIDVYKKLDHGKIGEVPSGIQNRAVKAKLRYGIAKVMEGGDAGLEEAKRIYVYPFRDRYKTTRESKYRKQISDTSGNIYNDVSGMFWDGGRRDSGSTVGLYLNGPPKDAVVEHFIKNHDGKHGPSGKPWKKWAPAIVRDWQRRNTESYWKLIEYLNKEMGREDLNGKIIIFDNKGTLTIDVEQSRNGLQKKSSALKTVEVLNATH